MRIVYLWLAALLIFVLLAGATGISLSNGSVDRAYHDTYYVVAHFHYALNIAAVFATIFFIIHRWTNRAVPLWAGSIQFTLFAVGAFMTFFPQHFLGLSGMPRRYIDYPEAFAFWNKISALGVLLCTLSLIVFVIILIYTIFWGPTKSSKSNGS
ncbi:cbb3-type cytochrome c oxidase subunit I [Amylibacter sp. IMCC11727]|uniref:cbb3-type cytochrome c oxidase subunit I n=1 Tax=Amylibacter sp. IMCC11727 TaxID=3039851 RepID=UPI00244DC117|nr:cbb3-type cytochrome c oxidase subunit I [Amylibacter sp. IMCC11727]WGI20539.1 cbb3-type cytochrome c oxidase subunit I [Amylibacter sp. IMCC11727]